MAYLKNKIITLLLFLAPLVSYGQWSYTFTDPCTLNQQTIQMSGNSIALNYFGNVQTFTQQDFTNGTFDAWMDLVTQANTGSPCESVTQVIVNTNNSTVVANTLTVVTNIMSIMGGSMLPPADAIGNSTDGDDSEDEESENSESGSSGNQSGSSSGSSSSQTNESGGTGGQSGSSSGSGSSQTSGGQGNTGEGSNSSRATGSGTEDEEAESSGSMSLANSVSNAVDGGAAEGDNKNRGSLIASGDIVVIDNRDNSNGQQVRVVGSITHANTEMTRIKGALFTFTSVTNELSLTAYKSWINPKKTFNLVGANTIMSDFKSTHLNTTTALESFKFGKGQYTGMVGLNFTIGKIGQRNLQNLSAVGGIHTNFKVSPRISTSFLMLSVYSPFTQFYEGKWWDPGLLIVPFSSWDIKITKTFKYNISFTGVWQHGGNALNYQVLTGGKIRF